MLPDSLVRAGAREASEGQAEKVASACSHYWTSFLCYFLVVTATGGLRFVCSSLDVLQLQGNMDPIPGSGYRSCISPLDHNRKKDQLGDVCDLGPIIFREKFLTFQPTIVVPRAIQ